MSCPCTGPGKAIQIISPMLVTLTWLCLASVLAQGKAIRIISPMLGTLTWFCLASVLAQGKALSGHVFHVGDRDMIMPCLCAGSRESTFRSCLPCCWPWHDFVLSVCWPKDKSFWVMSVTPTWLCHVGVLAQGKALLCHVYHVGDPDMIMSCLGDGSRESALGHIFDPDKIMSCLCTSQRKALLNHIVDPNMIMSCVFAGLMQGKCFGYVFHFGDPDMIMSCLCAGHRESALGHVIHVGDPEMIISCLCVGPRESFLKKCLLYWWPRQDYILSVCWPQGKQFWVMSWWTWHDFVFSWCWPQGKCFWVMFSMLVTPTWLYLICVLLQGKVLWVIYSMLVFRNWVLVPRTKLSVMSSMLVTPTWLCLVCVLAQGKALLGHVFHVGDPDMNMCCLK